MDKSSKYFDSIRIKKGSKAKAKAAKVVANQCQWDECEKPGSHKAPIGRDQEGQYLNLCIEHVREYNKSYNYFSGLGDDEVAKLRKDALTGGRPTWTMGVNKWGDEPPLSNGDPRAAAAARVSARARARAGMGSLDSPRVRKLKTLEKKSLDDLGLPHDASAEDIKTRYKEMVKRHHPDANGGDRSTEERLREIIQSYKHLKQAGFC